MGASGSVAEILLDPETGLTPKQLTFVKNYSKTGNGTKAALDSYDTRDYHTAASIASENLNNPDVVAALEAEYEKEGLTEDYVKSSARVYVERGKRDPHFAGAGVSALRTAAQVLGMVKDRAAEVTINVLNLSLNVQPQGAIEEETRRLKALVADLPVNSNPSTDAVQAMNTQPDVNSNANIGGSKDA